MPNVNPALNPPSDTAVAIDLPIPENLSAEFVYNFYTSDERNNNLGSLPAFFDQKSTDTFNSFFINHTRKIPRMVKISWSPITTGPRPDIANNIFISDNIGKVHSEETFTSDRFTTIHYQDTDIDGKYRFFVLRALREIEQGRPQNQQSSPLDIAMALNSATPDQVSPDFLSETLRDLSSHGIMFVDPATQSTLPQTAFSNLKDVKVNVRLNNKFLSQIYSGSKENFVALSGDEIQNAELESNLVQIQNEAIASAHSALIDSQNFEFEVLDYVDIKPIDTNGHVPVVQCLGYLIDKQEVNVDGSVTDFDSIVIESPNIGTTFDTHVRYAGTYIYKIRSVFLVEIEAQETTSHQNILVSFLVASQWSQEVHVRTEETVPPPPPADFNVSWDYGKSALRIMWTLPPNPQRDIKYIQLFRRATIYDPFEMIKMWDFNDDQVLDPVTGFAIGYYETPDKTLIETVRSNSPNISPVAPGFYLDEEFTKDSKYIYAVCAIDAHGFSSNYSIQFEASFDKFANKLVKKMTSFSNAPKAYPNAYLNQDAFVDTIKDSGHQSVKIVFNPDFIRLNDESNNDLKLVKFDIDNAKYKLQIINVDLQSQRVFDLTINDRRTPAILAPITTIQRRYAPIDAASKAIRQI